jgi:hypothetical protein
LILSIVLTKRHFDKRSFIFLIDKTSFINQHQPINTSANRGKAVMKNDNFWQWINKMRERFKVPLFLLLLIATSFGGFLLFDNLLPPSNLLINQGEKTMDTNQQMAALRHIEDAAVVITESGQLIRLQLQVLKDILQLNSDNKEKLK